MSYRDEVLRNINGHLSLEQYLPMGAMGLAGETGEVVDLVKKHLFQGRELDKEKVINELGDVRWYMEVLCYCLGTTLKEVEDINVAKLRRRYSDGFSTQASIEKKDVTNG